MQSVTVLDERLEIDELMQHLIQCILYWFSPVF